MSRAKDWWIRKTNPELWEAIVATRALTARILAGEPYEDIAIRLLFGTLEWDQAAEMWKIDSDYLRTGSHVSVAIGRGGRELDRATVVGPAGPFYYYLKFED